MEIKKFREPLVRLIDSLPDGATSASIGWNADGMLRTVSIFEQYGNPSTWQISLTEYPNNSSLQAAQNA